MADPWIYPKLLLLSVYIVLIKGQSSQCDNLSPLIPFCHGMPHNSSSFPNSVYINMIDSQTAELEIQTFQPIVKTGCSDVIREFLCSVYFPDCDSGSGDIPPCKEVCVAARADCEPLMNTFGFPWPSHLNCANFPSRGEKLCTDYKSKIDYVSPATTTRRRSENVTTVAITTSIPKTVATTTLIPATTQTSASLRMVKTPATTTKQQSSTTPATTQNQCSQKSRLAPSCDRMPYNTSSFPNSVLGFQTDGEASMEINQFIPLIKVQCSDVLKEFLCSAYFPECDSNYGDIPPCRETCEYAQAGCGNLMMRFGFPWPQALNCGKFPSRFSKRCAYYESKFITTTATITTRTTTPKPSIIPHVCQTKDDDVTLPNSLGHWNLKEAVSHFETFHTMLSSGCSAELSKYLCHVHFPEFGENVKPCWEYCLRVRTQCLFQLPIPWPKSFRCESFPAKVTSKCQDNTVAPAPVANIIQGAFRLLSSLLSFATSS